MVFENGFNDIEAFDIAISLESEGERFYGAAAEGSQRPSVKEIFRALRETEVEHRQLFEELKAGLSVRDADYDYSGRKEIAEYLRALVDTEVYSKYGAPEEMARGVANDEEALLIGIQAERDSIAYYSAVLEVTRSASARQALERILAEEKRHLVQLQQELSTIERREA